MPLKFKQLALKHPRQRKRRQQRFTFTTLKRFISKTWQGLRTFTKAVLALPPLVRVIAIPSFLFFIWFGVNWAYHSFNKPSEMLFPLDSTLNKAPVETWKEYESQFRDHATAVITPEFLAALAQVESGGNPVARTYWRWKLTWNPLEWYQPASSAVGMFQITDGTFQEARRYCIHNHVVVEEGPWHDMKSCWFNNLYTRIFASHAIELTAALLDRKVTETIKTHRMGNVTLQRKQDLAAVIHLCGAGAGRVYAGRGLRLASHQRCGDHSVKNYLTRINELKHGFKKPEKRIKAIRQGR